MPGIFGKIRHSYLTEFSHKSNGSDNSRKTETARNKPKRVLGAGGCPNHLYVFKNAISCRPFSRRRDRRMFRQPARPLEEWVQRESYSLEQLLEAQAVPILD